MRAPEDVPTPVAVAVSDYCRRARSPASAAEVREALSALSEADDFRVRELTDTEPEASPLGPFAVVDILNGTPADLAARRQEVGYYELARALLQRPTEAPTAPAPEQPAPRAAVQAPPAPAPAAPAPRAARTAAPTVAERIAPKKRQPTAPSAGTEEATELYSPPRHEPGRPRGRFSTIPPSRASLSELEGAGGREQLEALVEQHATRYSLWHALAEQYSGAKGMELRRDEVERVLTAHGLLEGLAAKERAQVLGAYTDQRGASGRVGWALGLSPAELTQLVRTLGLQDEVEQVRERFRNEALSPRSMTQRLDLLGRDKYLIDLGIRKPFRQALTADLETALQRARAAGVAESPSALSEHIAREAGTAPELVERALERLGLLGPGTHSPPSDVPSTP